MEKAVLPRMVLGLASHRKDVQVLVEHMVEKEAMVVRNLALYRRRPHVSETIHHHIKLAETQDSKDPVVETVSKGIDKKIQEDLEVASYG